MEWWQVIIPIVVGWVLGIGTIYLREKMAESSTRKRIAKLLVAEIESNQYLLEKIKDLKESTPWEELRDFQPAFPPFRKSAYLSLTDKLGVLDSSMIGKIQRYYALIEEVEHSQDRISESADKPLAFTRTFAEAYYAGSSAAAKVGDDLLRSFYSAFPSTVAAKARLKGSIRVVYDRRRDDEVEDQPQ